MEDKTILDLYFARDELAITETDRKYGGYCYSVANRILCNQEDSEETVSDTYWHAWNSIPPYRPSFLKMFLAKVTTTWPLPAGVSNLQPKGEPGKRNLYWKNWQVVFPAGSRSTIS